MVWNVFMQKGDERPIKHAESWIKSSSHKLP